MYVQLIRIFLILGLLVSPVLADEKSEFEKDLKIVELESRLIECSSEIAQREYDVKQMKITELKEKLKKLSKQSANKADKK